MSDKQKTAPRTIITLTLPTPVDGGIPLDQAGATLLIQRGDLAHVREFTYIVMDDLITAIREAYIAIGEVIANPPVVPEPSPTTSKATSKSKAKAAPEKPKPSEPTIEVPLKKGSVEIKISYLKIVGGETDAAAYQQAVLIAGKLIDGKLWDGQSPIRIDDVYTVQRRLKHLSEGELSLFALTDFVQVGAIADNELDVTAPDVQDEDTTEQPASDQQADSEERPTSKPETVTDSVQPNLI